MREHELLKEIAELKSQLFEANSIIDAIKEGAVDALVLNQSGTPGVYSLETADYTYRILIEKMGEGALSISDDGLILYCNEYFSKLMGVSANILIGTFFTEYVQEPAAFEKLLHGLKSGISKGELNLKKNGLTWPVYISLTNLNPTVAAIGMVITDLSNIKKQEEALSLYQRQLEAKIQELNHTNTNLEQFIHVISHDLKEPLRKIISYTSHLNATRAEMFAEHEIKNLRIIHTSAMRLNSLVDDLVKYSFSANTPENDDVDLNTVLDEVKQDLELNIFEKKATIYSGTLPVLSGSRVQMRQLFSNLLSNAIKYSKSQTDPVIEISTEVVTRKSEHYPDRKFTRISFRDNGIGMETSHLNKIFTIFQRLHTRHEYSGNGIGLAICKKIMENHSGLIDVESVQGEGSVFHLYFPIA